MRKRSRWYVLTLAAFFASTFCAGAEETSPERVRVGQEAPVFSLLASDGETCDLTVLRGMVGTLLQAERYGTPLAQSLRVLSAESREERAMKAEEKAARLPALLTVPMILFILPPLFIVLIGPAALRTMDAMRAL